jgi:Uma2 family endonuclease
MGAVTMTESFAPPVEGWTVDDLDQLPDIGVRYELFDGSLLVSPAPAWRHTRANNLLREVLATQMPTDFTLIHDGGVTVRGRRTYFIPDLCVVPATVYDKEIDLLDQDDVRLAVEVLSPSNPGNDLVLKRHYYATGGIPNYWIVDPKRRTLTVLALDGDSYTERAVVEPGQVWECAEPFPLRIDPGDFL